MQFILLGVTLLILLINVLVGLIRGFSRGLLRAITLIVAVIVAFFLSKSLASSLAEQLVPVIQDAMASNAAMSDFMATQPNAVAAVSALARMLVTPILFLICYVLLKIVTLIIYFIVRKIFSIGKPQNALLRLAGGAAMGLVAGLVGLLVFVTPVMGYTSLVSRTVGELDMIAEGENTASLAQYNENYIAPASKAPVASQLYNGIGSKLFRGLTTVKWNDAKTDLETEWFAVVKVVDEASGLIGTPMAEFGEEQSKTIHAVIAGVGESRILSDVGSGILNSMSNAWLKGDTFLGIAAPDMGDENIEILINGILRVFSTTTSETLTGDLNSFADMFDLMIKYELFDVVTGDTEVDLVDHVVKSGFLAEARTLLDSNERMKPVTVALSDIGMRVLVSELGLPENYRETSAELMQNMSEVIKGAVTDDGRVDADKLSESLVTVFAEHDVDVPDSATDIIAQGFVEEFTAEELNRLTPDEITDRLINRFSSVEGVENVVSAQGEQS